MSINHPLGFKEGTPWKVLGSNSDSWIKSWIRRSYYLPKELAPMCHLDWNGTPGHLPLPLSGSIAASHVSPSSYFSYDQHYCDNMFIVGVVSVDIVAAAAAVVVVVVVAAYILQHWLLSFCYDFIIYFVHLINFLILFKPIIQLFRLSHIVFACSTSLFLVLFVNSPFSTSVTKHVTWQTFIKLFFSMRSFAQQVGYVFVYFCIS